MSDMIHIYVCRNVQRFRIRKLLLLLVFFSLPLERLRLLYRTRQQFLYVGHIMPLFYRRPSGYSRSSLRSRNLKKIASYCSVEQGYIDKGKKNFNAMVDRGFVRFRWLVRRSVIKLRQLGIRRALSTYRNIVDNPRWEKSSTYLESTLSCNLIINNLTFKIDRAC